MSRPPILLVGNPNSGKTTLFNALTGLSAKTGNYAGITVEHREGRANVGGDVVDVIDVPGTYSLVPRSDDEAVAVRALFGDLPGAPTPKLVVVVVDATQLERNLYLVSQLRELPLPIIVALTMTDVVHSDGGTVDVAALSSRLGVPVVAAPATPGGADALKQVIAAELGTSTKRLPLNAIAVDVGSPVADAVDALGRRVMWLRGAAPTALGRLAAARLVDTAAVGDRPALPGLDVAIGAGRPPVVAKRDLDELLARLVQARHRQAAAWAKDIVRYAGATTTTTAPSSSTTKHVPKSTQLTAKIDAVALHPLLGPLVMLGVFVALFQALFAWSEPFIGAIEAAVDVVKTAAASVLPTSLPLLSSLVTDGIITGVGNVVVFVPQIAILFLFLAILEDTGYLARAAFLLDRVMQKVGLHGRAFVPLLSGFACAVPAIMATRTIENEKDRLVTILVTPLVSCSARLPVYALMIATVFSTTPPILGVFEAGTVVMLSMYGLSLFAAIGMAALFKRTVLKSPTPPLVLELPAYRMPKAKQVARAVGNRVATFLKEAGTVILAITVVLWALLTFPIDRDVEARRDADVAAIESTEPAGEARDEKVAAIKNHAQQTLVEHSAAGRVGHAMAPLLAPLGFDWKIGIGILASFAAREVFVSTLGIVYGLGEADEESSSLREAMQKDTKADGSPLYTPLTGLSLLVFFVLAMQCMSTIAVVKRETRSWKWPLFQVGYMTALAVTASLLVYQVGRLFGLS
ncbi:MAG TPA: ferrous iron transport protein B [Myxococcota bacterium]